METIEVVEVPHGEPKTYNDKIRVCYAAVDERGGGKGASPLEVTDEMHKRGWLSPMDTVIDVADLMGEMGYTRPGAR
jgi:hypothetical protein